MNTPFRPQQIAIVGAGASGCLCAYFLLNAGFEVTIFDKGSPLRTLLPTGGGRCNLAHAEYDFKELAKNYPRGEKFLYSGKRKNISYFKQRQRCAGKNIEQDKKSFNYK